jgi:hypothetical protein
VFNGGDSEFSKHIANEFARVLTGLPESRMPDCSSLSRNPEYKKRWANAVALTVLARQDFGQGLLKILSFIHDLEKSYECYSERQMLGCIAHVGEGIMKMGHYSWRRLTIAEKRQKIDGLLLQYENSFAGIMRANISVMTVHQSKSREFDTVIIPWFTLIKWEPVDIYSWDLNQPYIKELFHTACTRAKKKVIVIGLTNH